MNFKPDDLDTFELVMHALYGTDTEREVCTTEIFCRMATQCTPVEFDNFTRGLDDFLMDCLHGREPYKDKE